MLQYRVYHYMCKNISESSSAEKEIAHLKTCYFWWRLRFNKKSPTRWLVKNFMSPLWNSHRNPACSGKIHRTPTPQPQLHEKEIQGQNVCQGNVYHFCQSLGIHNFVIFISLGVWRRYYMDTNSIQNVKCNRLWTIVSTSRLWNCTRKTSQGWQLVQCILQHLWWLCEWTNHISSNCFCTYF